MPRLNIALLVGGMAYAPAQGAAYGAQVVVGTPGRVKDHLDRGTLDLSGVSMVVLDECDEMLNMGFLEDVEKILARCPKVRRPICSRPPCPPPSPGWRSASSRTRPDPAERPGAPSTRTSPTPPAWSPTTSRAGPRELPAADQPSAALIFTKTKPLRGGRGGAALAGPARGLPARRPRPGPPHPHPGQFKDGKLRYLVATDVAARGIDVEAMPLVVHVGIPTQLENYIHRCGRTGRAGSKGACLALVNFKESRILLAWSRRGGLKLEWRAVPTHAEIREARTPSSWLASGRRRRPLLAQAAQLLGSADPSASWRACCAWSRPKVRRFRHPERAGEEGQAPLRQPPRAQGGRSPSPAFLCGTQRGPRRSAPARFRLLRARPGGRFKPRPGS